MIYITCKDETEALQIGKLLIQKKTESLCQCDRFHEKYFSLERGNTF
jgi:hypothetical protein